MDYSNRLFCSDIHDFWIVSWFLLTGMLGKNASCMEDQPTSSGAQFKTEDQAKSNKTSSNVIINNQQKYIISLYSTIQPHIRPYTTSTNWGKSIIEDSLFAKQFFTDHQCVHTYLRLPLFPMKSVGM